MNLKRFKGFTLIEMIMVLAIISIIVAVAFPLWNKLMTYWDVETETVKIAAKIRETQQKAILNQTPYRIVFEASGNTYRVESYNKMSNSWSVEESLTLAGKDVYFSPQNLPYKNAASADPTNPPGYVLTFDEFGATSPNDALAAQLCIALMPTDGTLRTRLLYINKVTGSVEQ